MKKLKFYSGSKVPDTTTQIARQAVNAGADMIVPGLGTVMGVGQQLSDKLGNKDCEINPATGEEVCRDNSSVVSGMGKSLLDPVGTTVNVFSNLSKGNFKGAIGSTAIGKLLGVRDDSKDKQIEEFREQLRKQKEAQINQANQRNINQGLMQQQSFSTPSFGVKTFKDGGKPETYQEYIKRTGDNIPKTLWEAKQLNLNSKAPLTKKQQEELKKYQQANQKVKQGSRQDKINQGYIDEKTGLATGKIEPDSTPEDLAEIALTGGTSLLGKAAVKKGLQKAGQYTIKPMKGTLNIGVPFEIVKKPIITPIVKANPITHLKQKLKATESLPAVVKEEYKKLLKQNKDEQAENFLSTVKRLLKIEDAPSSPKSVSFFDELESTPELPNMFESYKKHIGKINKNDELYSKIQDELPAIRKYYKEKGYNNVSDEDLTNSLYHYWSEGKGKSFREDSKATSDLLYRGEKKFEGQNPNELNSQTDVYFSTPDKYYAKYGYADNSEGVKPLFLSSKNNYNWKFNPNDSEGIYTGYAQDYWGVGNRGKREAARLNATKGLSEEKWFKRYSNENFKKLDDVVSGFGDELKINENKLKELKEYVKTHPELQSQYDELQKIITTPKSQVLKNQDVESIYAKEMGRDEMSYVTPHKNLYKSLMREDLNKAPDISTPNIFRGLTGLGVGYGLSKQKEQNKKPTFKKGGYLKDKDTYITKDGKATKRGLWANVYLKKKKKGKLKFEKGGVTDCGCNKNNDGIDTDVLFNLPQEIIEKIHEISGVEKGKKYDNTTKEKIKDSAKKSGKSLREFITQIPNVEKHIIVIEKFQQGGMINSAKKYLSGTEQKMYESALKSGNKKAIQFLEGKINKELENVKGEQSSKNERLSELASRENGEELIDAYTNQNSWKQHIPFYNTLSGNNVKLIKSDIKAHQNPRELFNYKTGDWISAAGGYSGQELNELNNPNVANSTFNKIKKRSDNYKNEQFENIVGNLIEPATDVVDVATMGISSLLTKPLKQGAKQIAKEALKNKSINNVKNVIEDAGMIGKEMLSMQPELPKNIIQKLYDKYSGTAINPKQLEQKINGELKNKGFKDVNVKVEKQRGAYVVHTNTPTTSGNIGLTPVLKEQKNFFTEKVLPKIPEKYQPIKPEPAVDDYIYINHSGLRKKSDFPNLKEHKGAAPTVHNAINDFLKEKNMGNLLSGGTGHTEEGLNRWNKLVQKGIAEEINPKNTLGAKLFKLKKDGGLLFKKGGIYIDPKNKGKFTETKKRTGKSTEELTHSKNPLTKKRAVFAQNAKKWNKHALGGLTSLLGNLGGIANAAGSVGNVANAANSIGNLSQTMGNIGNIMGQVNQIGSQIGGIMNQNNQSQQQLSYQDFVQQMIQSGKITQMQANDINTQQQLQQMYNQYLQQNKQGSVPTMRRGGLQLKFKK